MGQHRCTDSVAEKGAKRMNTLFNQPLKVVNADYTVLLTIFNMPGEAQLHSTGSHQHKAILTLDWIWHRCYVIPW